MKSKFNYDWSLVTTEFTKDKGKVFSCFACGGGSTLGYKLAGFDVIGCNEIDPNINAVYVTNNKPKYNFLEPIGEFLQRTDIPEELYHLDILDGSPPCSSFSMAGNREKDWGKLKSFNEGGVKQILDTLFFDFIELGKKLQPKIIIAENVEGITFGKAKTYVNRIYEELDNANYYTQHFILNSSKMGVPQSRTRVFFIGVRKDLCDNLELIHYSLFNMFPKLDLNFKCEKIKLKEFVKGIPKRDTQNYSEVRFGDVIVDVDTPSPTITTLGRYWLDVNTLIDTESLVKIGSFPKDYNFLSVKPQYIIGMSVPPVLMSNLATEIYNQILNKM